ncbi:DeoR family transcriptional regulator [Achromobacter insolitus]|uniref:DeoR family transcriptional regulator n=1 Tax=Achromobacter insolitus TaxID=217204 RepID=UPI001FC91940|nr:DeoR family transcriptional regulator [Achromobacter insolitus]
MTLNPRQSALIEMVRAQGSATIEELAKRFDVTLQTVRRDVNILSEAGLLSRFHGGCASKRPPSKTSPIASARACMPQASSALPRP